MSNQEVIKKFLNREEGETQKRKIRNGIWEYEGRTLYTVFHNNRIELINYSTVIATLYDNDTLKLNTKKIQSNDKQNTASTIRTSTC